MSEMIQALSASPVPFRAFAELQAAKVKHAEKPDEGNAALAADALAGRPMTPRGSTMTRMAPTLTAPLAPEPDTDTLRSLQTSLAIPLVAPENTAEFLREALRVAAEEADEGVDNELSSLDTRSSSPRMLELQEHFKAIVGLESENGELVLPTVQARAALKGLFLPSADGQEPPGELLSDTPIISSIVEDARRLSDDELQVRMNADPRFAVVLMLVAFLLKMSASQREQAASMLVIAEKAIADMGDWMVDSAKQQRMAKVITLAVVIVVSTMAVGLSITAANRNIASIKHKQGEAYKLQSKASADELKIARGVNDAPGGSTPMTDSQRTVLRQDVVRDRHAADIKLASHAKTQTTMSMFHQTGQVMGQAGNAAGSVAGSGHEIEAARMTARQEMRRADANAGQQTSQTMNQNVNKSDESAQDALRKAIQGEQDRADANNLISGRIGK